MEEWMDGEINGWKDRWNVGWMDGEWKNGWMEK